MEKVVNSLIGLSVITTILTLASRLTMRSMFGVESRAMGAFTAILLLFAIALSVKK